MRLTRLAASARPAQDFGHAKQQHQPEVLNMTKPDPNTDPSFPTSLIERGGRFYELVLVWLEDAPKFARYLELLAPIVEHYGGRLERRFTPDSMVAEGMTKPDFVNLVSYESSEAFQQFLADPRFAAIAQLRAESIEMAAVGGCSVRDGLDERGVASRLYVLEIARFGTGGTKGYAAYEAEAEPVMGPYGYHVERTVAVDRERVAGFTFTPDLVKVAYFDDPSGLTRLGHDPAHARIESELYAGAVVSSVWIVARAEKSDSVPR
jgi:uncharacterized protein (DUF1330 family)